MNTKQFTTGAQGTQWAYSLDNGVTFRTAPSKSHASIKAQEAIDHRYRPGTTVGYILAPLLNVVHAQHTVK